LPLCPSKILEIPWAKYGPSLQSTQNFEKKLTAYLAVAGAAGVGLAVASLPAEAKVIYTKTNLGVSSEVSIDLNGDGVADINFFQAAIGSNESILVATAPAGNGWFGNGRPMFFGVPVGPGENFGGSVAYMATFSHYGSFSGSKGAWANRTNGYMGVKFQIGGVPHYGWVRLTVGHGGATITGYAYETIPNASIKTGVVSGPARAADKTAALAPVRKQASLGMLARGTDAIALWRREDESAA
jgi:hypothetical protein